eukprot:201464_1
MTIPIGTSVLLWSTITFWVFFWTPAAVYVLRLYYKNRHQQAIRARHYQIVIIIGCIFIYAFFIDRPIALIDDSNYFLNSPIWHTIHYILFPIQIHGVKLALVLRYFVVYFDLNFANSMLDSKWKSILNSNFDNHNWFLKHKKTYGNFSWQIKRYFIGWFILSILSTIIRNLYQFNVYSESAASIFHGIIIFTYAPILIYLYSKIIIINTIPIFYIKLEMQYITIIFVSQFIVYLISILLKQFYGLNDFILQCIWSFSGMIAVSLYLYFFTIWTLKKCVWNIDTTMSECSEMISLNTLNTVNSLSYRLSNQSINRSELPQLNKSGHKSPTVDTVHSIHEIDLFEILKHNNGYQYFMEHLMSEINYECLLSFTEMVQFKIAMKDTLTNYLYVHSLPVNTGSSKTIKDILLFQFSDIVPLSSIIYKEIVEELKDESKKQEVIQKFKQKAYDLFVKYIYDPCKTCEYEINISYSMRDPLIRQLKHYNDWMHSEINERELFCLYDECIIEMYDLMHDGFVRFKKTNAFGQLCRQLVNI